MSQVPDGDRLSEYESAADASVPADAFCMPPREVKFLKKEKSVTPTKALPRFRHDSASKTPTKGRVSVGSAGGLARATSANSSSSRQSKRAELEQHRQIAAHIVASLSRHTEKPEAYFHVLECIPLPGGKVKLTLGLGCSGAVEQQNAKSNSRETEAEARTPLGNLFKWCTSLACDSSKSNNGSGVGVGKEVPVSVTDAETGEVRRESVFITTI